MITSSGLPSDFPQPCSVDTMRLRSEKVRLLYANIWQPVSAGILGALVLAAVMRNVVDTAHVVMWFIVLLAVSAWRLCDARRFLRSSLEEQANAQWLWRFALGALVAGCTWGGGGVLMFQGEQTDYVAFLVIVLSGVAAGSVTMLSAVWWVAVCFIIPISLPLQVLLLLSPAPTQQAIGGLIIVFVGLLILTSRRLGQVIHDNISLRMSMADREAQLLESENRYRSIFQNSPLGVLHFDEDGKVTDCNSKLPVILGVDRRCIVGHDLLVPSADPRVADSVRDAIEKGAGYYEGTYHLPNTQKKTPLRAFFNGVHGMDNRIIGGVAIIEDFTERKRSEEIIYRQAYYDALTDLPNRRLFIERLESLDTHTIDQKRSGLVLFLDMDRFKLINDTLGHAAGDALLVQVARRLESCLRDGDMAARLSGDEFVLLALFDEGDASQTDALAEQYMARVQQALSGKYWLENRLVDVTPSMGYTCFDTAAYNHVDVLKQADIAMYQAKSEGRARLRRYQPWMSDEINRRVSEQSSHVAPRH
ncbi:sensor domain-containing diguanylate cyclase [Halomonas meridiana]|uniref:sensor domain-containing diguanylate cyclase n=1 Tax=Halomonadaceae TaxID=28256 RepID=UPI00273C1DB3|nr:sensor domain-containing diguanylate cyclase [Halomonas meridiana]MDP4556073.1 sensor domain-containing diguanylate cyclase [Halomonas meridiana]